MSENRSRGNRDFSQYDSMETEELEEILRLDPDAPEDQEPDVELLLYVMEVLADRRKNSEHTGKTALEAFESFKQDYLPDGVTFDTAPEEEKPKHRPLRWLRVLTATAAVLAFVFLGSVTANALGFDIWKSVAVWAQETFHFESYSQGAMDDPVSDVDLPYASLEEAIYSLEMVSGIVPTWIPDGYKLTDITIDETPIQKVYIGFYENGDKNFRITVQSHLGNNLKQIEQSDGYAETYMVSDIVYYIFTNYDQLQAAWVRDLYECHISGDLTVKQIEDMIDSIEKG